MQYRVNQKNKTKLSVLGYGCMRFTKNGGTIDQKKANEERNESKTSANINIVSNGGQDSHLSKSLRDINIRLGLQESRTEALTAEVNARM